ncbi:hypothetical protein CR513_30124, partial [Mucuna pruriens]
MKDNKTIDLIFGRFQTIINRLRSLGKTYDNYDYITKILRSLPRRWRLHVATVRASQDLKKISMEELLGTLKMKGNEKENPYPLKAHKAPKGSSSKAFKVEESCGNKSNKDCSNEDELSFISRKFQSM